MIMELSPHWLALITPEGGRMRTRACTKRQTRGPKKEEPDPVTPEPCDPLLAAIKVETPPHSLSVSSV